MGERAVLDPTVGGSFAVNVGGTAVRGRFLEVDPPSRLVISWGFDGSADLRPRPASSRFSSRPTVGAPGSASCIISSRLISEDSCTSLGSLLPGLLIGDNGATTLYDHMGNPLAVGDGEVPAEVVGPSGEEIYKSTYGAVVGHEVIVDFLEGDPDHPLTVGYDSGGRVDQVTDPLGNVTRYNYDAQNRLVSETPPDGGTTTFSYDPASGELNQVTAPSPGGTTQYSYEDDNGHWEVNKVVDPLGRVTTYSYDSLGRQVSTTDPLGNITTYSYDPQGHIDQVNDPDGSRSATAAYDSAGNITAVTDPLGNTVHYSYDAQNRMIGVQDPIGRTTTYDYAGTLTRPRPSQTPAATSLRTLTMPMVRSSPSPTRSGVRRRTPTIPGARRRCCRRRRSWWLSRCSELLSSAGPRGVTGEPTGKYPQRLVLTERF